MKLVVGLGNPGVKYKNTRHNVGFMVLNALLLNPGNENWEVSKKLKSSIIRSQPIRLVKPQTFLLAKPNTYMNSSGEAVSKLVNFYKTDLSDLWIIHDDLDIKLGQYKIQFGIGPKVHNGLNSIEGSLGSKNFWRVRVGVDNRIEEKGERTSGEDYVLQNFTQDEKNIIDKVITEIVKDLTERLK